MSQYTPYRHYRIHEELPSAGVYASTYGIQDQAKREELTSSSNALRLSILRMYERNAQRFGGDIWDAAARCGMQP